MTNSISPIIQAAELLNLYKSTNLVLVDVSNEKDAKTKYEGKHLDGAVFVDLNTQLADIKDNAANGGRHPLPHLKQFETTLSDLGISSKSHVVIYDSKDASNAAARFWWMLKAIGHEKVQVLNGGIQAAEKISFPINGNIVKPAIAAPYAIESWKLPLANMEEVESCSLRTDKLIIDVRSAERYNGLTEPIDLIAGHIPNAINVPFTSNLDGNGLFLSPDMLRTKYEQVFSNTGPENVIIHCGSGVTACHTLLAIAYAGLPIPKLYVGSWSEWSRNNKAMVTKAN